MTSKKLPNVYKKCPKMISQEKLKILTPVQKLLKNVGDLGKLIVCKSCPKFNKSPNLVKLLIEKNAKQSLESLWKIIRIIEISQTRCVQI